MTWLPLVVVAARGASVAVCAADPNAAAIAAQIQASARFDAVFGIDCVAAPPPLDTLLPADVVLVSSAGLMPNGDIVGDRLADYADAGGNVVVAASAQDTASLSGRFSAAYLPFTGSSASVGPLTLGTFDATHAIMAGVDALSADELTLIVGAAEAEDATVVARWSTGDPLVAESFPAATAHIIGLNLGPVPALLGAAGPDGTVLLLNALELAAAYDADSDGVVRTSDCAPFDEDVHPGADELCNDQDDDCNGVIDDPETVVAPTWYPDADGDGFGASSATVASVTACDPPGEIGWADNAEDCDDQQADIHPGSPDPALDCVEDAPVDTAGAEAAVDPCGCQAAPTTLFLPWLMAALLWRRRRLAAPVLLAGCACPDPAPPEPSSLSSPLSTPMLQRLTDSWWRNAVEDLVGVRYEGALPVDYVLHGYAAVGATEITVAPLDLEIYETAVWSVAEAAVPDAAASDALLGCSARPLLGEEDLAIDGAACVEAFAADLATRAWRRAPDRTELDDLATVWAAGDAVEAVLGVQAIVAAVLLSPDFLFRVAHGRPDATDPSRRLLTHEEVAARLAFAWTATLPNDILNAAVAEELLGTGPDVAHQAVRLVTAPEHAEVLTDWFAELVGLPELYLVDKDPVLFPGFTDSLRAEMEVELRRLFQDVALSDGLDLRALFSDSRSWTGPELASLYGADVATDAPVLLPAERSGLLGRAAIASIYGHATLTSPTLRGKFVRSVLLCQDIPPPPAGVMASIDALPEGGTLRDRLSQHMEDPACASCHTLMDPLGFAMENLDPVGAWRTIDAGSPIDSSGELDGAEFHGPDGLGEALAAHPDVPACFARNLWRHALGRLETPSDEVVLLDATDEALAAGNRLEDLVAALTATEPFRSMPQPDGGACESWGATRPCATSCGAGTEVCVSGSWSGCTAPFPETERCDGRDQDCDGFVDEGVVASCVTDGRSGLATCQDGTWSACAAPAADEACNGGDDDGDGEIDEGLAVDVTQRDFAALAAHHASCTSADPGSLYCRSASHRACQANGCAATGVGAVAADAEAAAIACFDASTATPLQTTYGTLASHHGGCSVYAPFGPDCNAAIHRWCAAEGLGTGFGPVEAYGDDATVVCVPAALVRDASYAVLATWEPTCDGAQMRAGAACDEAIHRWCRSEGFATGFGPVENSGDLAVVGCVGTP